MKPFDIDRFMLNVRREGNDLQYFATADWTNILSLFRLQGENFVRAAYLFVLRREADDSGLSQYVERSKNGIGKMRILLSLYSSPECGRTSAWKRTFSRFVRRLYNNTTSRITCKNTHTQPYTSSYDMEAFYFAFENRFRGEFSIIQERLEMRYSAVIAKEQFVGQAALDLGCGRGEAVAFFGAHGLHATGVDGNSLAVKSAVGRGLNVVYGDLFAHLAAQKANSLAVVSAFHVIEHLPFEQLMKLVDEMWRVLRPDGLLLLETPNARNLLVSGGDFYRDPTHLRPIFPDTLDFLLQGTGFEGQAFFFDVNEQPIPTVESKWVDIQDYFHVSRDMAWIGRKTSDRRGW